ncbi:unnamed protein product [Rodentolepis nana]|uniref:NARG2_C domain-containing protein n=1 Tax=Rodentolepis nana TaxID=102285 RepID=A0A0R3T5Q2_RODNA|nr:unnamed protein product [Rodentolepis nana]
MRSTTTAGEAIPAEDVEKRLRKCLVLFTEKYYPDMAKMLQTCAEMLEQSKENSRKPETVPKTLIEKPESVTGKEPLKPATKLERVKEDLTPKLPVASSLNNRSNSSKDDHLKNCLLDLARKYHPDLAKCIDNCVEERNQMQPLPSVDPTVKSPLLSHTSEPMPVSEERKQTNNHLVRGPELYHPSYANGLHSRNSLPASCPSPEGPFKRRQLQNRLLQFPDKYRPDLTKSNGEYAEKPEELQFTSEPITQRNSKQTSLIMPKSPPAEFFLPHSQSKFYDTEQDLKVPLVRFAENHYPEFTCSINRYPTELRQPQGQTQPAEPTTLPTASTQPMEISLRSNGREVIAQRESERQTYMHPIAEQYHPKLTKIIVKCVDKHESSENEPFKPLFQDMEPMKRSPMVEDAKKGVQLYECLLRFTEKYQPELGVCIAKCVEKLDQLSNKRASFVQPPVDSGGKDLDLCLLEFAKQNHPELARCLGACMEKVEQSQGRKISSTSSDLHEIEKEKKLLQNYILQLTKIYQPELAKLMIEYLENENNLNADHGTLPVVEKHENGKERELLQQCLLQLTKLRQPDLGELEEQRRTDIEHCGTAPRQLSNVSEPFATEKALESTNDSLKYAATEIGNLTALGPIKESLEKIAEELYPDLVLPMGQCVALGEDSNVELASPESTQHKMRIYLDGMENLAKVSVLQTDCQETRKEEVIIETPMSAIAKELSPVDVEFIMERQSAATSPEAKRRDLLNSVIVILKHIWPELMECLRREVMDEPSEVEHVLHQQRTIAQPPNQLKIMI